MYERTRTRQERCNDDTLPYTRCEATTSECPRRYVVSNTSVAYKVVQRRYAASYAIGDTIASPNTCLC